MMNFLTQNLTTAMVLWIYGLQLQKKLFQKNLKTHLEMLRFALSFIFPFIKKTEKSMSEKKIHETRLKASNPHHLLEKKPPIKKKKISTFATTIQNAME